MSEAPSSVFTALTRAHISLDIDPPSMTLYQLLSEVVLSLRREPDNTGYAHDRWRPEQLRRCAFLCNAHKDRDPELQPHQQGVGRESLPAPRRALAEPPPHDQ